MLPIPYALITHPPIHELPLNYELPYGCMNINRVGGEPNPPYSFLMDEPKKKTSDNGSGSGSGGGGASGSLPQGSEEKAPSSLRLFGHEPVQELSTLAAHDVGLARPNDTNPHPYSDTNPNPHLTLTNTRCA